MPAVSTQPSPAPRGMARFRLLVAAVVAMVLAAGYGGRAVWQRHRRVHREGQGAALLEALERRDASAARLLLERGADANACDARGYTALTKAIARLPSLTGTLLDHGANMEARDRNGRTPLLFAGTVASPGAMRILTARGANVNARDHHGETPLRFAVVLGNPSLVSALLARG